jgi:hypothetical protein
MPDDPNLSGLTEGELTNTPGNTWWKRYRVSPVRPIAAVVTARPPSIGHTDVTLAAATTNLPDLIDEAFGTLEREAGRA